MSNNDAPAKPRAMDDSTDTVAGEHTEVQTPRFIPSGLKAYGYQNTRIRRFQRNQTVAVIGGLAKFEVYTKRDLREKIGTHKLLRYKATSYLQSCLVGPEKRAGAAQLFRKGDLGLAKMLTDLSDTDVVDALCRACDQVAILQDDEDAQPAPVAGATGDQQEEPPPAVSEPTE